jgi:3-hydroxybutyryl-CoA dehydratase
MLNLEDLQIGQRWLSPSRVISADDVTDFADLTGDHTPLHAGSSSDTMETPFGRPVVHGLLGLSIMAGLSSEHPRVNTLALVSLGDWEFRSPIYFGDSVHVETEVVSIEPHGRRAGRVRWNRRLIGARGQILQEGTIETLVARQHPTTRKRGTQAVPTVNAGVSSSNLAAPVRNPR